MRGFVVAAGLVLAAASAVAEVRNEEFAVGNQTVQIEVNDLVEVMWVGPSADGRTQVLSGADIEIVGFMTDDDALQMLGGQTLVAVVSGTHSCENLGDPRDYYVVTLGDELATDGPLSTCVELSVSVTAGSIVLEEDPMGDGEFYFWVPGQGFGGAAN
ncbi:MAG: hypothetical protein MUE83_16830 [Tabrizicola sp.]|jgi:hypothetical protein|nr:hypothetical protein [Tabrizicola sp.]